MLLTRRATPSTPGSSPSPLVSSLARGIGRAKAVLDREARSAKAPSAAEQAKWKGYEGDPCGTCHSFTLKRTGVCVTCDTCGSNSGCS